ncbi:MAG TPA: VTT domain-containing protein [Planctomycetota bacterium]|nr:VTT domain-containing protein [Planctomycetota bacterium]
MEFLQALTQRIEGLPLPLALVMIALATFVSEDLACIAAALIAARGELSPLATLSAAGLGIWAGDLGVYALGAAVGRPLARRRPVSWFVDEAHLDRAREWFAHRGTAVLWIARLIPGTRLATYLAAGTLHAPFLRFAWVTFIACLIWTPLLGGAAYFLGVRALELAETYKSYAFWILVAAVVSVVIAAKLILPMFTWRGRRMLVGRWIRWTHWEFWPPWAFYPPIVVYVLGLAWKHRSLTLFTAVNPAMPAGGFIGESKLSILSDLGMQSERIARARCLPAASSVEERIRMVAEFQLEQGLGFPIVLKPDAGQRGSGVKIVHDDTQVAAWIGAIETDAIVQQFASGLEFGIFYYRYPGDEQGRVFSMTRKVFPELVGNGTDTLEDLILADSRAVAMAEVYFIRNQTRLWDVPAAGERVQLVDLGNHCQGAIFLDGTPLLTPQIESAIDHLSRGYEGFYFGRYDVRTESIESFRAGLFTVIELNGATSEATHIYDPKFSVFEAWRTLREQWRILFEIARRNRARGTPTVGVGELWREMRRYRREARSHPG